MDGWNQFTITFQGLNSLASTCSVNLSVTTLELSGIPFPNNGRFFLPKMCIPAARRVSETISRLVAVDMERGWETFGDCFFLLSYTCNYVAAIASCLIEVRFKMHFQHSTI